MMASKRYDPDDDGDIREAFKVFDKDGDGTIRYSPNYVVMWGLNEGRPKAYRYACLSLNELNTKDEY